MFPAKKLPLGIQTFRKIIEGGYYYVDKTGLACDLIEQGSYYFLSRPRRFGKSLFLDTLKSIFAGDKALFTGLAAEKRIDWSQSWPIIRLDFARKATEEGLPGWQANCLQQLQAVEAQYGVNCRATDLSLRLAELIGTLHRHTGRKVVVLVDEYDKPILDSLEKTDSLENPEQARIMRDFLAGLYSPLKSEDEHLQFVMLSGVSKFSKVSLFSGLNHLTDISLDARFATICGYTENDLQTVFADQIGYFPADKIKRWYNGYHWLGESVYNPWSLLELFSKKKFSTYWIEKGMSAFLVNLLRQKDMFLPDLAALHTDDTLLAKFDLDDISPEALLFQTGYLTIKQVQEHDQEYSYTLGYPNWEVEKYLNTALFTKWTGQEKKVLSGLGRAIAAQQWDKVRELLHARFAAIPYHYHVQNNMANYEGWYASVFFTMLKALDFQVVAEDVTNHGRIDLTLLLHDVICLFEFKVQRERQADSALGQILARQYADKYRADGRTIVAIGITFSADQRNIIDFSLKLLDLPQNTGEHSQQVYASQTLERQYPDPIDPDNKSAISIVAMEKGRDNGN